MGWFFIKKKIMINFMIVGVARCGTTSVYQYLKQHPDIAFPKIKEPKYFSSINQNYPHNGPGDLDVDANVIKNEKDYNKLFIKLDSYKCVGEASSDYFYFHKYTIPLIKKKFGSDLKIIICLRNPIERAFSAYNNLIRDSREYLSFYDGLLDEEERIKKNFDWMWHYSRAGFYLEALKDFKNNFKNVHVVINEDLAVNTLSSIQSIYSFLDVDSGFIPNISNRYSTSGRPKNTFFKFFSSRTSLMSPIRNFVVKFFPREILEFFAKKMFKKDKIDSRSKLILSRKYKKEIKEIEEFLKIKLTHWK